MNEESIFAVAMEKRSAAEREAFLNEACAGKPELRSAVDELLRANENAGSFMEHPPIGIEATVVSNQASRDTANSTDWGGGLRFLEPCDKPGRVGLLGQYEIIEIVGYGGMGAVLRAMDTKLSRVVAVKVMSPGLATNPMAVKRFLREATTAASIHHDHVVTIHAVNDSHVPPYLVMQFVEGQTLQQKIDREGALQLKHVLRIGSQAAAGLAAAHKLGLIHRDVKPANILLENGVERVKITDFGLARAADDVQMTQPGIIAGTPQYMSPEQARGESLGARSDLFSLGSVLYTMCTGRPAFRAENPVAMLKRVCEETPRPIHEVNPEIPSWLEAIIDKLLAKNPSDRFQSASEVADLLGQHLAHVQNPALAPRPPEIVPARSAPVTARKKSTRWTAPAVLAAAITALLLIGFTLSEAAGVTQVAATIIRVVTGEGTLVIEADDPSVKVAVNGEEVTIQGAGVEEVKLRPGSYKLTASKDGQPVPIDQELVTITRGGKQVVRVSVERPKSPVASASPQAESNPVEVAWQPPEKPDPSKILEEAQADTRAGRYETALAKHVWFHEHALEHIPGLSGVRVSYALINWGQLCEKYPPAYDRLVSIRDAALANIKEGTKARQYFHDLMAINRTIDDEANTRDAFAILHAYRPDDAKNVYSIAQPSLIRAKAYKLCSSYLDAENSFRLMVQGYQHAIQYSNSHDKSHLSRFGEPMFTNNVTTLVALLVANSRQAEAEQVVADAKKEWDNAKFHARLEDALKGNVPEPWPPSPPPIQRPKRSSASATKPGTAKSSPPVAPAGSPANVTTSRAIGEPKPIDLSTWGGFVDPRGDCQLQRSADGVTIVVPGGPPHNLLPVAGFNLDAPRLLQEIEGDFLVQVTLPPYERSKPDTAARDNGVSYRSAGLLVWVDEGTFLRWERSSWGERTDGAPFLHVEWYENGKIGGDEAESLGAAGDRPAHFRIERRGSDVLLSRSDDGRAWTHWRTVRSLNLPARLSVGLMVQQSTTGDFSASFKDLAIASKQ